MTDLVIHIGLPKTGTTTIQHRCLAGEPHFLGKDKSAPGRWHAEHPVRALRERVFHYYFGSEGDATASAEAWIERVRQLPALREDPSSVIISDEVLAWWPTDPFFTTTEAFRRSSLRRAGVERHPVPPVAAYLRDVLRSAWRFGSIRVLLTVRSQPEWLASLYAQVSGLIRNAGTADFERQVRSLMEHGDPYIDWHCWAEHLERAVGPGRVQVLATENMGSSAFWQELGRFLGVATEQTAPAAAANVRRTSADPGWSLKKLNAIKILERDWPPAQRARMRRLALGAMRGTRPVWGRPLRGLVDRRRERQVCLRSELREEILAYVAPSNQRLAARFGLDLGSHGYLPTGMADMA